MSYTKDDKKIVTIHCDKKGCKKVIKGGPTHTGFGKLWGEKGKPAGWQYVNSSGSPLQYCPEHAEKKVKKASKAAVKPVKKTKPSKVAKVKKAAVKKVVKKAVKKTAPAKAKTTKKSAAAKKFETLVASSTTPKTSRSDLLSSMAETPKEQPSTMAPEQKDGVTE